MRYLTLGADYLEPTLVDLGDEDSHNQIDLLSEPLLKRIRAWGDRYQLIIPMEPGERAGVTALIEKLDAEGLALAALVAEELAPAKVQYYSEGLLRRLP